MYMDNSLTVIFLFGQEGIALITKAKGKIEYKRNSDDKVFDKINKKQFISIILDIGIFISSSYYIYRML